MVYQEERNYYEAHILHKDVNEYEDPSSPYIVHHWETRGCISYKETIG